jgi:CRP/FNR family transcriptional regulator, cyclic AMP receptor protein
VSKQTNWLHTLPAAEAKELREASRVRSYKAGESVFGPSRHPNEIYVLEDGLVRILRVTPTGAEFTIRFVQPGEIFGEISVMSGEPRETFAQAKTASRVLHLPGAAFLTMLRAHNSMLYSLAKRLAGNVLKGEGRAEDLVFLDVRARLARLLLRFAEEYGHRDDQVLTIGLPWTHEEIATVIGTSRQTVSLHLSELTRAGLVARRGRQLLLPNPGGLETIAWNPHPPDVDGVV